MDLIQTDRLVHCFKKLVEIDSISFKERAMAEALKKDFAQADVLLREDQANESYGSEVGNLYGYLPGSNGEDPLLFSCHMDTVEPGIGKKAIVHADGKITSDGKTILGADDLAGMSALLEALHILQKNHLPHRPIEILLPFAEEAYVKGSRFFDFSKLKAKEGYILDLSAPIGTASLQEPTLITFTISVYGKAAHAGFAPEKGIHAIAAAAEIIRRLPCGRMDEETVSNIGMIHGGIGTNIVPEKVVMKGELRSYSHDKAMQWMEKIRRIALEGAALYKASVDVSSQIELTAYQIDPAEPIVRHFEEACRKEGIKPELTRTFGGSDANSLNRAGKKAIVLASAMYACHTRNEYTTIEDMKKVTAVILRLMRGAEHENTDALSDK